MNFKFDIHPWKIEIWMVGKKCEMGGEKNR